MNTKKQHGYLSLLSFLHLIEIACGGAIVSELMKDGTSYTLLALSLVIGGFIMFYGIWIYRKFLK